MDTNVIAEGLWLNKNGRKICYNPWTHFEVNNPNGDVTMCNDNNTVLGNVNHQTIEEIWNGEKYQMIREQMYSVGGEKLCNPNCLLLNGGKHHQNFAWYKDIDNQSDCYSNALENESEIKGGKTILTTKPRWMRFALSYKCNYQCYHCYQKNDRILKLRLPESFVAEVKHNAKYYQFLFPFGGEPTMFHEFNDLLKVGEEFPHIQYGIVTNGSLIHKHLAEIKKVNWAFIAVSLDAASKEKYELLKNVKLWNEVNRNIRDLSSMKIIQDYRLILGMTLNSKNYNEIYDFVSLANSYDAIPKINLVSNSRGSIRFQQEFLSFDSNQRRSILDQIKKASKDFPNNFDETGLNVLEKQISGYHKMQIEQSAIIMVRKIAPAFAVRTLRDLKVRMRRN